MAFTNRTNTKRTNKTGKKKPCSQRVDAHKHILELGETRISDLYDGAEGHLIGVMDKGIRTIYVAESAEPKVKRMFGARQNAKPGWWRVRSEGEAQNFRVRPLHALDRDRPVRTTDVFAIAKRQCSKYPKGTCINFYNPKDGTFSYSWKATGDVGLCSTAEDKECKETLQTNTVELYPEKDCAGKAEKKQVEWMFCDPV